MISVTIDSPHPDIGPQWDDLITRASSNVFMNPAALQAACETNFARIKMLLAWAEDTGPRKLVGIWALHLRKVAPLWPMVLEALPYNYAFLSSPVVDPAFMDEVIPAFFAAIEKSPSLPKVVSLKSFDAECPSYPAMLKALAGRGIAPFILAETARPFVTREFGVKRSGSTRKKLRQDWNRLSACGTVDVVNDRTLDGARHAFESFLALEKASWKGVQGSALLSDSRDAAFVRRMFHNLAARQDASVALLRVDGEAIAAQVLMYCGATAYTWKTRLRCQIQQVFAGYLADRSDDRGAFRRAGHSGDQFLRRRRKLHGPAVGRAPHHGRHAGPGRHGKIAGLPHGSRPPAWLPAPSQPARPVPEPDFGVDS